MGGYDWRKSITFFYLLRGDKTWAFLRVSVCLYLHEEGLSERNGHLGWFKACEELIVYVVGSCGSSMRQIPKIWSV